MRVGLEKQHNLEKADSFIEKAARMGAEMAVLPEVFNGTYTGAYATRMNQPAVKTGEDKILKAPTGGKEYNVTQMLNQLYEATSQDQIVKLTEDFMTLENDLVYFVPLIEKTAPFRIYDTKLSLADGTLGQPQNSFYYYGNLNNILSKMLRDDQLYFVK
jgi:peptide/nickel transport system substrate-binding protein